MNEATNDNGASQLSESIKVSVVLLNNGEDHVGGPYEATIAWLLKNTNANIFGFSHPLFSRQESRTKILKRFGSADYAERYVYRPNLVPFTYVFDLLFWPKLRPDGNAVWIAFNPLTALSALIHRRKSDIVIRWSIDFVPIKSKNPLVQRLYLLIDKMTHKYVDFHWEVSDAAINARRLSTGIHKGDKHFVVPMGIWESAFFPPSRSRFQNRKVVYFGSVNNRNGIPKLVKIIEKALEIDAGLNFVIIGSGDCSKMLSTFIADNNLFSSVKYHGFIDNPEDVYKILSNCAVAIAPFAQDPTSFTAFADPSKFKAYLAAGLPILSSDVPPNVDELASLAGARIIGADADDIAYVEELKSMLIDFEDYIANANKAIYHAENFIWSKILEKNLTQHL